MNDALYGGEDKKKLLRNVIIPPEGTFDDIENYCGGLISTGVFNPRKLMQILKEKGFHLTHNAMYDFEIPMIFILATSKEGDIIADIYSGMATTGLTAFFYLKRRYLGIEFSAEYVAHSKARFEAFFEVRDEKIEN